MRSNATVDDSNPSGFPGSFFAPDYLVLKGYFLQYRYSHPFSTILVKLSLSTGDELAFHRIAGRWLDALVKAWFSGAKMNNAMSRA